MQANLLKVLSNPTRLALLYLLSPERFMTFDALATQLGTSRATLSKHLTMFRQFGLVEVVQEGRSMKVRLARPELHEACALVLSIIEDRIRSLENELDMIKES